MSESIERLITTTPRRSAGAAVPVLLIVIGLVALAGALYFLFPSGDRRETGSDPLGRAGPARYVFTGSGSNG